MITKSPAQEDTENFVSLVDWDKNQNKNLQERTN